MSKGYNLRQPSLRQIQAFKAFVETGTVSKAADLLFISQPAASKLLTHLEQDTGLHLLDRGHGKMNVTERGMRLYDEIDRIFSGVDQIGQAIETIRQEDRGHLTIGLMPAVPGALVAQATKEFVSKYPDVFLSFHIRSSEFIVDGILARKFDFGIVLKPLDHDQFTSKVLDDGPLVAVIPENHKLAKRRSLSVNDLCSHPFIGYSESSASRHVLERLVLLHELKLDVVLEATTANTVIELVAQGIGIAVVHPIQHTTEIAGVKFVPLKDKLTLPIHVVRALSSRRDATIDDFLAIFGRALKDAQESVQ
ncbi:LysR family transcriptional regulator [uncultured Roseobacter sp.]|uniref:LysR family transcriptional regulator n=1 Tax=uncultured Roseobacter sp. TaxID=114847 RepID=UPI002612D2C8|nr:LysR family transcriptional regulator [uncultured Roseobacter sp.]